MKYRKYLALLMSVMVLITAVLSGCGNASAPPSSESQPSTGESQSSTVGSQQGEAAQGKEAPMLAAMVQEGNLPALAERLPESTFTVQVRNEIGTYGGTYYGAFPAAYAGQAYETLGLYEPILTWNADRTELIPNIIEFYEVSEDGKTIKIGMRKGMKWSNGDPFDTEDIRYAYEDVWKNKTLTPAFPSAYQTNGNDCTINVIDEYNFEMVFVDPNPALQYSICRQGFTDLLIVPSRYLKQFNNKYTDEETLTQMAKEEGFDDWIKFYTDKSSAVLNPERPSLFAWKLSSVSEDSLVKIFERNPYYFKLDNEGNQLPYMDKLQVEIVDNPEALKLKVMSGEVDMIYGPTGEVFSDYPMLSKSADDGNYRLAIASGDYPHVFCIFPNLASEDPQKGQLLSSKDFRVALSYAINREEIISLLYTVADFKGEPAQQSPVKESPYYDENLTKQYTEYNPEKANEILDGLGLTERDNDGYRLGPDGEPMAFQFTIPTFAQHWVDGGTRVAEHWKAVGLNVEVKAVAPDIFEEMRLANKLEFHALSTGSGGLMVINSDGIDAYSVPIPGWAQSWGTPYGQYVQSNGESGVKPPEFVDKMNELRTGILFEADKAKADANVKELLKLFGEVFPVIGVSRPLPQFIVCSNDIQNEPEDYEAWVTFTYGVGANVNPCQFYKK